MSWTDLRMDQIQEECGPYEDLEDMKDERICVYCGKPIESEEDLFLNGDSRLTEKFRDPFHKKCAGKVEKWEREKGLRK